jgi:hypothetical protein
MNKTGTSDGFAFKGGIIKKEEYNPLLKESLKLLEGFCVFDHWEYYKNLPCVLVEAYKTIYGTGTPVLKNLMNMFDLSSQEVTGQMM